MQVAIYGKLITEENIPYLKNLFSKLEKERVTYLIHKSYAEHLKAQKINIAPSAEFTSYEELNDSVDCMFSIGGDGTFLDSITFVRDLNIPVVGINAGTLGFLSNISKDEIEYAIDEINAGNFTLDKRSLLTVKTENNLFGDVNFALNDLTIHKYDSSSMITIHVYLNDEFLNSYWSDGLIISTPTGSTAYSLSCGGPIITPGSGNFIINPVAPHNLNVRPVVIPDDTTISIKVEGRSGKFLTSLDSKYETVSDDITLTIKKADFHVNLLRLNNQNFLSTLRNKLMWGLDRRN
ncbi:MAG: NAD kinase [Flavobacteriales bacterium]|nr:NAD kinase [Flavobacteriales bacterium]